MPPLKKGAGARKAGDGGFALGAKSKSPANRYTRFTAPFFKGGTRQVVSHGCENIAAPELVSDAIAD